MLEVYVVVVTYNGMKWYERCFDSLRRSSMPLRVVVVDNASTDNTLAFIEKNYPEIHIISNSTNAGFGAANNLGISYGIEQGADFVYLLNQDAGVEEDTIEGLVRLMNTNEDYAIVSPLQYTGDGKQIDDIFFMFGLWSNKELLKDLIVDDLKKDIYDTEFVMAAHWLVRVEALKRVGGFSPVFRHYGEDNNLVNRMTYHGYGIGIAPKFKAWHDHTNKSQTNEHKVYMRYVLYLTIAANPHKSTAILPFCFLKATVNILRIPASLTFRLKYILKLLPATVKGVQYKRLSGKQNSYVCLQFRNIDKAK